jgi:HEAT repeat protein
MTLAKRRAHANIATSRLPRTKAMLEHLTHPDFDDPLEASTPDLLAAQARTVSFLEQMGSPEHILEEDQKATIRNAFAQVTNPNVPQVQANAALLKLRVPEAVKHLANMLSQYDWDYVEQAKEIRGYVVAKLMEETTHPDAKIRLAALKALGNITEVGAFTERIQITKVDATSDELTERIRAKLASLLPKVVEVETVEAKP